MVDCHNCKMNVHTRNFHDSLSASLKPIGPEVNGITCRAIHHQRNGIGEEQCFFLNQ